jgi:hypothetical protein
MNHIWSDSSPRIWIPNISKETLQMNDVPTMAKYLNTKDPSLRSAVQANTDYAEYMWYHISTEASQWATPNSLFLPPLHLNDTDATRRGDINAVLKPFLQQAFVEFITGTRDISSDSAWNAYLAELDRLGSPELVKITQKYIK